MKFLNIINRLIKIGVLVLIVGISTIMYTKHNQQANNLHINQAFLDAIDDVPLPTFNIKIPVPRITIQTPPQTAQDCLQEAMYLEAGNQGYEGMVAVANVIMNRVNDGNYPKTVCAVVHQGKRDEYGRMIRDRCQFSYYCDGRTDVPTGNLKKNQAWKMAREIAHDVVAKKNENIVGSALHYHADRVHPTWADVYQQIKVVGNHIFYE